MCHGLFLLMESVNLVFPGEGRWPICDAAALASEETGVQLSQKFFFGWKTACSHFGRCVFAR